MYKNSNFVKNFKNKWEKFLHWTSVKKERELQ